MLINSDFEINIRSIEEFARVMVPEALDKTMNLSMKETSDTIEITMEIDGRKGNFIYANQEDKIDEQKQTMVKILLLKVYEKKYSWGGLMGVRPTKVLRRLLSLGYSYKEAEEMLRNFYIVSDEKIELLINTVRKEMEFLNREYINLYIGIPFCPTKCKYCSFASYEISGGVGRYYKGFVETLLKEIEMAGKFLKDEGYKIESIYIGGGTPSTLTEDDLEKVLKKINENIDMSYLKEFTFEAGREDSLTEKKLELVKKYGADRISLNPQTFNENTLKKVNRNFNRENLIGIDEEIQKVITFPLTYKDIDEIAIENKTYLLNFDEVNTKVEMLYYSTLLLENNVLSKEHRSFLLKGDIINFTGVYKKKYDYIENCMGRIIQAIGRCNRTKLRNKKRNIYMDEDSFDVAKKFEERNRLFIEDINFILSEAKRIAVEEKSVDSIVKDIISQNYKIEKSVEENFLEKISDYNNKLRFSNDNIQKENYYKEFYELVKKYNSFRKFILKNPTRERTLIKNPAYFSIGEKLSGYNVIRNDWNSIKNISFDSVYNNVSFNDSRIKEISEIPLLKNFCSENIGTFVENEEIILPYIYQAIFKGMLGEVIIKEIFRMYRIKLKDIDFMIKRGIFEKFDDITENGIYIDYKNYNLDKIDSRDFFNEIIEDSVLRKEELINSKNKLFIINLIAEKGDSKALYCYKISDLFNDINKICDYNESEVVIINGVLRYKDNKSILEINENLLRKLQKILGGNDE